MPNPKRPRDANQRAKLIVEIATGESKEAKAPRLESPAAVELGRLGGRAGAKKLTSKQRSTSAKKAVRSRWEGT
jgi:hypothetical protein